MTINVSREAQSAINAAVRSGRFASAEEMIDRLVRDYAQHDQSTPSQVAPAPKSILEMVDELRQRVPPEELARE